jgi:hypothetical protein
MTILRHLIPFYGAIEELTGAAAERIRESGRRETLRTEQQLKRGVLREEHELKRELLEAKSRIAEKERDKEYERIIEIETQRAELADLPAKRAFSRQITFEKHRVKLFEQLKRAEVEIHQQIQLFDIEQQKQINNYHRDFMRNLESEAETVMTERAVRMLKAAEPFLHDETTYNDFRKRIFETIDRISASIAADQEHFRSALKELATRPGRLTDNLLEMSRQLRLSPTETKGLLPPPSGKTED